MAEPEFTRTARRPAQIIEAPILQWASGLPTANRQIYAGWLLEAGKLDELDTAMQDAGFNQITIKHGSGKLVTHWAVETANVFVIAEGVQTIAEMKHTADRFGVAFGWRTLDGGRAQSVLRARVILRQLAMHDYIEPITLSVKSTTTGDVISALMRQYDVLDAVDAFRKLDKKPEMKPPFYACSIGLTPGQEVARGSGGQTKEIYPPIANIPNPITKDYIRANWIMRPLVAHIESLIDATTAWSIAESRRISADAEPVRAYEEESMP